jgi:lipopolysaccharide transport system ATP-binding protein
MKSDIAVKIEGIGKRYNIGQKPNNSLRSNISAFWKMFNSDSNSSFWALKDINLDIKKGQAIGIIGRNGAGKSTLLKVLSRITKPDEGNITLDGRVASLLEVGTGFHPELTGRENIYLNGTILGMSRREVKHKLDKIVEFSGISKFIDTPVKHYSSGMYVRLGFSVAAHLNTDILIIDEVLAVGDAEFQKRCLGKMDEITNQGKTVLFVSHNMAAINSLCDSGILIEKGRVKYAGDIATTVQKYLIGSGANFSSEIDLTKHERESGVQDIRFEKITFNKTHYYANDDIKINFSLVMNDKDKDYNNIKFGILFIDQYGNKIYHLSNIFTNQIVSKHASNNIYSFTIPKNSLSKSTYQIHIWLGANEEEQDLIIQGVNVDILDGNIYNFSNTSMIHGIVQPEFNFSIIENKELN